MGTRQLQGELGNRHTHILIFIVIDCTEFFIAHLYPFSFNKKCRVCEEIEISPQRLSSVLSSFLLSLSLSLSLLPSSSFLLHLTPSLRITTFRMLVEAYNKIRYNYNNNNVFTTNLSHTYTQPRGLMHPYSSHVTIRIQFIKILLYGILMASVVLIVDTTSITSGTVHQIIFICSLPPPSPLSFSPFFLSIFNIFIQYLTTSLPPLLSLSLSFLSLFPFFFSVISYIYNSIF